MARKTRRHRMAVDRWPTTKITGVGVGGTLTTVILWFVPAWFGVELTPDVAAGITTIVVTVVGYVLPRSTDQPE